MDKITNIGRWNNGNKRYEMPILRKSRRLDGVIKWWNEDSSFNQLLQYKQNVIHGVDLFFEYKNK